MYEQPISNIGTKIILKHDGPHLMGVSECDGEEVIANYSAVGNVLEKWSKASNRHAWIEFSAPIALRYTTYGDMYTVNACELGGVMPPSIIISHESKNGILRHFRIGHDILLDWFARIA